jgi:hypothetical protein
MKKWDIKPYVIGLILLSFLQLIYSLRTNTYFSVDDFFEIAYFRNHSILQFIPDFLLHGDINEFTKITGFVFFSFIQNVFGLNHLAFDISMFLMHTSTVLLLFFVVRKISNNDFGSFFVSMIFNKNYLFYYSNIHEYSLALFCILTIFLFLYFPKKFYLIVTSFILALFSKETAVTLPLVLYSISFFYKFDNQTIVVARKRIMYLFIIAFTFGVYASYFYFTKKVLGENIIYTPAERITDVLKGYLYFIDYKIILVMIGMAVYFKKYIYLPLLLTVFITLTPASVLVHRREAYYIYMPFLYLMIYLGSLLPKISLKSSLLYLLVFMVFGGRDIFPKIAWQEFPNWQKVSIDQVLDRAEVGNNDFSDLILERDAKLMIGSGTTDLFLEQRRKERND